MADTEQAPNAAAQLAQVTAERDSARAMVVAMSETKRLSLSEAERVAYARADFEHAARVRLVEQYDHLNEDYDAAIAARDNCFTEHSRALLRVGVLAGLLKRWHEYFYELEQVPGAADLLIDETDAALAGTVGEGETN